MGDIDGLAVWQIQSKKKPSETSSPTLVKPNDNHHYL